MRSLSYVEFESAATLGRESKNPHQAIPRSVIVSLTIAGIFFIALAYIEILGFPRGLGALDKSSAPLNQMASYYHVPWFAPLTDLGAMVSLFSCTLASLNAGSRILYSMGQDRHFHRQLGRAHHRNRTPHVAVTTSAATVLMAVISLAGLTPFNAYGYFGTYATYGFILVYMLIATAAPVYLRKTGELSLRDGLVGGTAFGFMLIPLIGSIFPVPAFPYNILPYAFIAYLASGYIWYYLRTDQKPPLSGHAPYQTDAGPGRLVASYTLEPPSHYIVLIRGIFVRRRSL